MISSSDKNSECTCGAENIAWNNGAAWAHAKHAPSCPAKKAAQQGDSVANGTGAQRDRTAVSAPPAGSAPVSSIEPQGTFACSVCGLDTPHWHDVDAVNRLRVIERVVRPAFEQAYTELARAYPDIRVSGWGHGFARRQEKDAPDPVANPSIIAGWYDRWTDDSPAPAKGEYKNPVIQALWRLWVRSHESVAVSATRRMDFLGDIFIKYFDRLDDPIDDANQRADLRAMLAEANEAIRRADDTGQKP